MARVVEVDAGRQDEAVVGQRLPAREGHALFAGVDRRRHVVDDVDAELLQAVVAVLQRSEGAEAAEEMIGVEARRIDGAALR